MTKSSDSDIDDAIADLLRNRDGKKSSKEPGINYIFEGAWKGDTSIYKVGKSESPTERRKSLKSTCRFETLTRLPGTACRPIRWFSKAERLIQAELGNYQYRGSCPCGTRHTELFRVQDVEMLLEIHWRWHTFCASEPWDEEGRLLPKWKHRLDSRPGIREGCGQSGLADSWRQFANPTALEKLNWSATYIWSRIYPFLCQAALFATALCLAYTSRASLALVWLSGVTVAIMFQAIALHQTWLPGMMSSIFQMTLRIPRLRRQSGKVERFEAADGHTRNTSNEGMGHRQSHRETRGSGETRLDTVEGSNLAYEQDGMPGAWSSDGEAVGALVARH